MITAVGVSREGHPPRTYSWYAGVQRQLPWRFAIDAAYVGNRGTNFAYLRNVNQLPLGYTIANPPPNNTPDAIRPYRGYTAVNMIEFGAESEYHGLQARLTRRFGQQFTANLGYWVRTSQAGRGVAPRAIRHLASFAFAETDLQRLEIVCAVGNQRSQRAAEKAGAHREGILRARLFVHGQPHDAVMYSIVRSSWGGA